MTSVPVFRSPVIMTEKPENSLHEEAKIGAKLIAETTRDFGFHSRVIDWTIGPVCTFYELQLERGCPLAKLQAREDDIAIALGVRSLRIVWPIVGSNLIGLEVPHASRRIVRLRDVMVRSARAAKMRVPLYLGLDVVGWPLVVDLTTLPHLLIAGCTGTGKSVALNSIICSILLSRDPADVRLILIDPKLVELSQYRNLPHLMHPVVTDPDYASLVLEWAVQKMEERCRWLARAGCRNSAAYNRLSESELLARVQPGEDEHQAVPRRMPAIVIVIDEMGDLMMTGPEELEAAVIRLAQKARAAGIHLVLATQKPTVDVITGRIKSNLAARVAFRVVSGRDSHVILDQTGAEKLLGNGDLLALLPGEEGLVRAQGSWLSDTEIEHIIAEAATGRTDYSDELTHLKPAATVDHGEQDADTYAQAVALVRQEGRAAINLIQRRLHVRYSTAADLIEQMEADGIVGKRQANGSREVLDYGTEGNDHGGEVADR